MGPFPSKTQYGRQTVGTKPHAPWRKQKQHNTTTRRKDLLSFLRARTACHTPYETTNKPTYLRNPTHPLGRLWRRPRAATTPPEDTKHSRFAHFSHVVPVASMRLEEPILPHCSNQIHCTSHYYSPLQRHPHLFHHTLPLWFPYLNSFFFTPSFIKPRPISSSSLAPTRSAPSNFRGKYKRLQICKMNSTLSTTPAAASYAKTLSQFQQYATAMCLVPRTRA